MALTLFSRKGPDLPEIRRFEPPLDAINLALEHACRHLDRGSNGSLDGRATRLDRRNREIVKAVEEILNVVIPSLQGAAAILEDPILHPSNPAKDTGVEGQVRALRKSIATAVRELQKGLECKKSDPPKFTALPRDGAPAPLDGTRDASRSRVSATRAIASAKRHLQSLHLPAGKDAPGDDAAPALESRIAKTMNEVAFQTNLLTLNAAVESFHSIAPPERDRKALPSPPPAEEEDPDERREFDEFILMDPRDREMLAEFYP
jgi:hypothetical protein